MVYRKLYINIIFRVILLIATSIWFAFVYIGPIQVYTLIVVTSLIIIQGYAMVSLLNKFNREVFNYFASLKDFSSSTHFKVAESDGNELYKLINEVSILISNARIDKEQHFQYLNFIVDNIPVGIVIVGEKENIILSNNSVKKLFSIPSIKNINNFEKISSELNPVLKNMKVGEKELIKVKIEGKLMQILVDITGFKIGEEQIRLFTFQDVKSELEKNEVLAWQKLVRVLNHELMNSITPITTLTLAIKKCLAVDDSTKSLDQINSETLKDVIKNADLIEERSKGLIQFISNYRNLTSVQTLELSEFGINDLFQSLKHLFDNEIQLRNIKFTLEINPIDLTLNADRKLVEQVMINLIKNAIEALDSTPSPKIKLKAHVDTTERILIAVTDNGKGVDEAMVDDIFIPFFTTKKEGSGIGLSFSRQIMRLHGGEIAVSSDHGNGSVFTLSF